MVPSLVKAQRAKSKSKTSVGGEGDKENAEAASFLNLTPLDTDAADIATLVVATMHGTVTCCTNLLTSNPKLMFKVRFRCQSLVFLFVVLTQLRKKELDEASGQAKLWLVHLYKLKQDKASKFIEVICYALRQAAAVLECAEFVARHATFNADGSKALQLRRRSLDLLIIDKDKNGSEFFQVAIKAAMRATRQYAPPHCFLPQGVGANGELQERQNQGDARRHHIL